MKTNIMQEQKLLPNIGAKIKFRTIFGWLVGKRVEVYFSYGDTACFYISDNIEENKHWATFLENEIYEWYYSE